MKKIFSNDDKVFTNYILTNPIVNTYIIGNYNKYGLNSPNVNFFTSDEGVTFILMKYFNSFVFYTDKILPSKYLNEISNMIINNKYEVISGNSFSIEQLIPFLNDFNIRETKLLSLSRLDLASFQNHTMKKLDLINIDEIYDLLININEFSHKFNKYNSRYKIERMINEDIVYGSYKDNDLTGIITVTAVSNIACMLTDICVKSNYRNKGIAKNNILFVSKILFDSGIKYINLYVDNPNAAILYEKIGFKEITDYRIISNQVG